MHHLTKPLAGLAASVVAAALLTSCGSDSTAADAPPSAAPSGTASGSASTADCTTKTPVTLQLQWLTQAQFAGYIEAGVKGMYDAQCLDVTIVPAGADTVPQLTVADGGDADFAIAWVPKALQSREQGANITDVGQVFQRSGTLQVSMKSADITDVAGLKGKNVGDWGYGNEYELFAGMTKAGLDPAKDVNIVQQAFDMDGFLKGDVDAAQAMIYNEYALVLESMNPDTGKLYTPDDLNVLNWNDDGTAMLQDAIWANSTKLEDPAFQDTTVKFLTASYQGWIACASDPMGCAADVVSAGDGLAPVHQQWQMNEVNKLIWPSPQGIGMVDQDAWDQTVTVASTTKNKDGDTVLTKPVTDGAYTNDYTAKALANLQTMGLDVTGADYKPVTVTLTEGGK